jgi:hypothetical protein
MIGEITHMKAFTLGLESLGTDPLSIGKIPPTPRTKQAAAGSFAHYRTGPSGDWLLGPAIHLLVTQLGCCSGSKEAPGRQQYYFLT